MNMKTLLRLVWLPALIPGPVLAADNPVTPESTEQVILPQIDRREISVPHIRARDFEFGAYVGVLNIESFGVNPVYGARVGYHVTEDFFVEAAIAGSTVSDTAFRDLGIGIFAEEENSLIYYNLSVGVNLFPGEIFFGRGRAWGSAMYLIAGVGNTSYDILDNISYNFGMGLRVLPTQWWSVRVEMRDHMWKSDLLGTNKMTHNLEFTLGVSLSF